MEIPLIIFYAPKGTRKQHTHFSKNPPETTIEIRQNKYLNNRIEGDHRFIKRRTRPMLGFKKSNSAKRTLSGIETIHMIRKNQLKDGDRKLTDYGNFVSLLAA